MMTLPDGEIWKKKYQHFEEENYMSNERLYQLIENTLDWASEVSEQLLNDLIKASGITNEELNELGFNATKEEV